MLVACLLMSSDQGGHQQIQMCSTMRSDLFRLRAWLTAQGCEAVAMESTGVEWKGIWNVLEGEMELLVCHAQPRKAVPGRKTDSKDAEWIADLLQHGLLQASFVPARSQPELRDLTRYRSSLTADRARWVNRIQQTLEDTPSKLACVLTASTGKARRTI
jgi:transposase